MPQAYVRVRGACTCPTTLTITVGILKANTYLLQCHFKKLHIINCPFIYKKVKTKGGLGWMKNIGNDLARFLMGTIFLVYDANDYI